MSLSKGEKFKFSKWAGKSKMQWKEKYKILLFTACLLLSSSSLYGVGVVDATNYESVKNSIEMTTDIHVGSKKLEGPRIYLVFSRTDGGSGSYFLRSSANVSKEYNDKSTVQLYVIATFPNWRFLKSAYSEGKKYSTTQIERETGTCGSYGCSLNEHITIDFTLGQIKKEILDKSVFTVKLVGRKGDFVFSVPIAYFEAFVDRLENK